MELINGEAPKEKYQQYLQSDAIFAELSQPYNGSFLQEQIETYQSSG